MKKPHTGGKPAAKIDLAQLEQLCAMQCTDVEVAAFFKVSTRTIERKRLQPAFREIMDRGQANGRTSLRRAQWKAAMAGDRTMLVWLGKQILGQKDKVEHAGPNGGPIEISEIKVTLVAPAAQSLAE